MLGPAGRRRVGFLAEPLPVRAFSEQSIVAVFASATRPVLRSSRILWGIHRGAPPKVFDAWSVHSSAAGRLPAPSWATIRSSYTLGTGSLELTARRSASMPSRDRPSAKAARARTQFGYASVAVRPVTAVRAVA